MAATLNIPQSMQNLPQNMGLTDRIVRSALGGALLMSAMDHRDHPIWSNLSRIIGGAFVFYGLTGYDPLLKAMDMTTVPGDEKNVMNRINVKGGGMRETMTQPEMGEATTTTTTMPGISPTL